MKAPTNLILNTANSAELAEAADANMVIHGGWAPQHTPGMRFSSEPNLTLIDSGLPCDTFNIICRARLTTAGASQYIHQAIDYFRTVGRPFAWWVGPADQPENLGDLLVAAGLVPAESELAMAADLATLPPGAQAPADLVIRRVQTSAELADFATVVSANWTPPDRDVVRFYKQTASTLLAAACPQWLYVGYLHNQPVAAAEGVVGGGVIGLYNICTKADYRRRGVGAALTLQPLLDARRQGLATGVLQAAAAGVGIYQRLGFASFGDITEYKLPA